MAENDHRNNQNAMIAEAIRLLAAVILALGLIVAGFYAKAHHVDDTYFFYGAAIVIMGGVFDRIF